MTSDSAECFVYVTLPGQTSQVTAGRYRLTEKYGRPHGEFVYGKSYLARREAVEFDPFELPLRKPSFATVRLGGLFGALRDASPDSWGRRVIDKGLGAPAANEVSYLLHSPDDRAGALGFGLNQQPPAPLRAYNRTMDLPLVMAIADQINDPQASRAVDGATPQDVEQVERLLRAGTSMGGARPKATVEDDGCLWIAKFPHPNDRWNNPRVEHATMELARACGLACAETRMVQVSGRDVVLVKRFDREGTEGGYLRHRMVSALTMLRADEGEFSKWSYLSLAEEVRRTAGASARKDLEEMFRRICFNALVSNLDDHPRNSAFLARSNLWRLSPAYDLTPSPSVSVDRRDLAMAVGTYGRYANRVNLLSQPERFLLSGGQAEATFDGMEAIVRNGWHRIFQTAGVSNSDCEAVSSAFAYGGLFYLPTEETVTAAPPRGKPGGSGQEFKL
jgi:serine/threonine-protein kinase HipA